MMIETIYIKTNDQVMQMGLAAAARLSRCIELIAEVDISLIYAPGETPIFDATLSIYGSYQGGFTGDGEQPAEPAGYVIESVKIGDVNITNAIPEKGIANLQRYVAENT